MVEPLTDALLARVCTCQAGAQPFTESGLASFHSSQAVAQVSFQAVVATVDQSPLPFNWGLVEKAISIYQSAFVSVNKSPLLRGRGAQHAKGKESKEVSVFKASPWERRPGCVQWVWQLSCRSAATGIGGGCQSGGPSKSSGRSRQSRFPSANLSRIGSGGPDYIRHTLCSWHDCPRLP